MNVAIPWFLTLGEELPSAGGPGCSKPCLLLVPLPLAPTGRVRSILSQPGSGVPWWQ